MWKLKTLSTLKCQLRRMPCSCVEANVPVEDDAISFVGDDQVVLVKVVVFLYPFPFPFLSLSFLFFF